MAALLSRDAISGTLTRHYLSMIGMLSAHSRGLKIMRDFSMWSMLQPLVQLDQRDDLGLLLGRAVGHGLGALADLPHDLVGDDVDRELRVAERVRAALDGHERGPQRLGDLAAGVEHLDDDLAHALIFTFRV